MKNSNTKTLHERYHSKTKRQLKIIKDNNFTYRLLLSVINKHLKDSNQKILDIGCGAGTLSLYLAKKNHNVLGIDISDRAINECQKSKEEQMLNNLNFKQFEFPNSYPKEKFDVVLFTEVIEHLEDDKKALQIINKLLKSNGLMILSTPSNTAPLHKLGLTENFDKDVGHLRRYSLKELERMVKISGFKIIETKKTEGILRNFLFLNPVAGKLVRFLNYSDSLSNIATLFDNITLKLFGESNIIIVAKKM